MPRTIPSQKARQGRRGVQLLLVLAGGLILAALVWFGVETYGKSIDLNAAGEQPSVQAD